MKWPSGKVRATHIPEKRAIVKITYFQSRLIKSKKTTSVLKHEFNNFLLFSQFWLFLGQQKGQKCQNKNKKNC